MRSNAFYKTGFTLVELLVVVAVVAVLLGIVIIGFFNVRNERQLDFTAKEVRERFEEARSRTLASHNDASWGVALASDQAVLFEGDTFDPSDPDNEVFDIPPPLEIANADFAGEEEMYFVQGTGQASNAGSLEIRRVADTSQARTITVSTTGVINIEN